MLLWFKVTAEIVTHGRAKKILKVVKFLVRLASIAAKQMGTSPGVHRSENHCKLTYN